MPKDGTPRRRMGAKRRAHHMRSNPATHEPLSGGDGEGLTAEQLVAHRELAVIRNPSPERYAKLAEARRRLERERTA